MYKGSSHNLHAHMQVITPKTSPKTERANTVADSPNTALTHLKLAESQSYPERQSIHMS